MLFFFAAMKLPQLTLRVDEGGKSFGKFLFMQS